MATVTVASLLVILASPATGLPSGTVDTDGKVTASPSGSTIGNTTAATGANRVTTDGDTLDWVSTLSNNGALAAQATVANLFDTPASSPLQHVFRGGSLEVPQAFTPEWFDGAVWSNAEPATPSTVTGVKASGLVAPGPNPGAALPVLPILDPITLIGQDGWDVAFYKENVYFTPHHSPARIYCFVKASKAACPGSPYPFGTSFWTSGTAGPAIDRSNGQFWEAGFSPATVNVGTSTGRVQLECVDLDAPPTSCGSLSFGPTITTNPQNVVTETTLVDGKVYFLYIAQPGVTTPDPNRKTVLGCWQVVPGQYCPGTDADGLFTLPLGSWQAFGNTHAPAGSVHHSGVWLQNGKLYLQNQALHVTCWDPVPDAPCAGFPPSVDLSSGGTYDQVYGLVPRIVGGMEDGFCGVRVLPSVVVTCMDGAGLTGQPVPAGLGGLFSSVIPTVSWHSAVALGTRVYVPRFATDNVQCYDFALPGPCAGFANVPLVRAYAVRVDPYHEECLWANSDRDEAVNFATVKAFDAFTGAACGKEQRFAVEPANYYCAGPPAITRYATLSLTGLQAGDYTTASVSISDTHGVPIPGHTNIPVTPANHSVSLAGIPYGPSTTSLTVVLTFAGTDQSRPSWVTQPPPTLNITWEGPPIEAMCFTTDVPPLLCALSRANGIAVVSTVGLKDATGASTLGPVAASFDYQAGANCPGSTGTLKVCKVAGPGVAIGTPYSFSAATSTFSVPAGSAPGGTCVVAPGSYPVGAVVTVKEAVPAGDTVVSISVAPSGRLVGTANVAAGSVDIRIGTGTTEVTFTDKRTGFLEICKQAERDGLTGTFTFHVEPGGLGPFAVPVGGCTPAIELPAGPVTITEPLSATTVLVDCVAIPAANQGACNTTAQSSTVTVVPGDVSTQTLAIMVNDRRGCTDCGDAPADFDGDGRTDVSVFRPAGSAWYLLGAPPRAFGVAGDVPVPADYDGDGRDDIAVFRPSTGGWYVQDQPAAFWGVAGDLPVPADYDGDGRADLAVYRPSSGGWYVPGQPPVFWGIDGDTPVPGDYDGDGRADRAVFRPSTGGWHVQDQPTVFWGLNGDIPVPGDYDGDGRTDLAIFRPTVGGWYVQGQPPAFWGLAGDIPVPGDYDGDGRTELAVYRPPVGGWFVPGRATTFFGLSGDIPLPLPWTTQRPPV
jgi:hypothetical protein